MATVSGAVRSAERASPWRPVAIALAKSGAGSLASGFLSALGAKLIAVMLGPPGLALVATLQQTRDTAVLAATANGRTGLVRGASALQDVERREYLRTVLFIFLIGIAASASVLVFESHRVAAWAGLPDEKAFLLAWLALPVALTAVWVFLISLVNALGEIGTLAWSQVLVSGVIAAGAWPMARLAQAGFYVAVDMWLAVSATVSVAIAFWTLRRHRAVLRTWFQGLGRWWSWASAWHFFSISGALLATGFLGSMIMVLLRARIARKEGLQGTGMFDAAWGISMSHVVLVLAFVQNYYLSSLARATGAEERRQQMARVLMVVTVAAAFLVAALELARPWVLTLLYSASFQPASALLRWTLLGDYLKVTSWVVGMPMLAVADMKMFVAVDCLVQTTFFLCAVGLATVLKPSQSTVVAFLFSYAVNLGACYCYSRARHGFRVSKKMATVWCGGLALVVVSAAI